MELNNIQRKLSKIPLWIQKIAAAGLIAFSIQLIFIYIKYGEFSRIFLFTSWIDPAFTFLYFLALFWIYPRISGFIHSPALLRLQSLQKNLLEGVTVIISTLMLTAIVRIFPMWILIQVLNAKFEDLNLGISLDSVRQSVVVHTILGLFIYYFVEREKIRKQIQAEHLRYAQLQREEFKGQLENLKNQVNPNFLFSNLKALDSLIEKEPEEAVKFVNHLSYVYRSFLDREDELGSLAKEMELVEAYTYLLKTRFGDNIQFNVKIPAEYMSLQIPPGCLQILIENAVLNNEITAERPLHIKIYTEPEKLVVKNDLQQIREEKPSGVGLKNIIERYKYLTNETVQMDETGKEFVVKLPLLKLEEYEHTTE